MSTSNGEQQFYTRASVPTENLMEFRKTVTTRAVKIEGTFHCLTSEGNVASCTNGWLAIDSRGYPYPINSAEFADTYDAVVETFDRDGA